MESTITSVSLGRGEEPATSGARDHLVILATCEAPTAASSRHTLDDIDEVRFGRGERSAHRKIAGGKRVLELRVPDPRMSSEHGRLFRGPGGWVLDDPDSKNGAVVDGAPTRRVSLAPGALVELGRTFLLFGAGPVADDRSPDVLATELATPHPALATFTDPLAQGFAALARIAPAAVSVVLLGATGTGKEVVARALHDLSRRPGAFVAVNCGGLPDTLVENELFGHKRGAFSGAVGERTGLVRSADGGTLFLDEIAELPPASQAAFLRVLQESEVTPIGADRPIPVDLRVCCATLRDLEEMVDLGVFRRDLYARLFGYTLELPPLCARRADLGLLLATLLQRIPRGNEVKFAPGAMRALLRYGWPLNIRELERVLTSAVALSQDNLVDLVCLPENVRRPPTNPPADAGDGPDDAEGDRATREQLVALLTKHEGNVVAIAAEMGKRRMQIYRWLKRYELDLAKYRR